MDEKTTPKGISLEEYKQRLNTHDWNYHYTDDHSVYLKQAENELELLKLTIGNDEFAKEFVEARTKFTKKFD